MLSHAPRRWACAACVVSISALSDRIAQRSGADEAGADQVFQYPLFRIELLSRTHHHYLHSPPVVSISALSDRIAQQNRRMNKSLEQMLFQYPLFRIELLSQRTQPAPLLSILGFNIRSFGSNCSALPQMAWSRRRQPVSISALSDRIAQPGLFQICTFAAPCFNIRSFGSNCSARAWWTCATQSLMFQYPLFRIELLSVRQILHFRKQFAVSISALSDRIAQPIASAVINHRISKFQYPLFRIELLSKIFILTSIACIVVSISALSDRIAQRRC